MSLQSKGTSTGSGATCWCGEGSLRNVTVGGVDYLHCRNCGGELDRGS